MDNVEKIIAVHNGTFHPDDVFAVATIEIYLENKGEKFKVIRTRDEEIINKADYVLDVGMVYDKEKNRFDHHQGLLLNKNNIPFSSFGLVWDKFGSLLCNSEYISKEINRGLVAGIDSTDNGIDLFVRKNKNVKRYGIFNVVRLFDTSWKDGKNVLDDCFAKAVYWAKDLLKKEIEYGKYIEESRKIVSEKYNQSENKKILVLDEYIPYEFPDILKETLIVVCPSHAGDMWTLTVMNYDFAEFDDKKIKLPKKWAGKKGQELKDITGISNAIFCHRGRFFAATEDKSSAIKMAELAIKKSKFLSII